MRRRSPDVHRVDDLLGVEGRRVAALDIEATIAALEPLCTPERSARLRWLVDRRVDSVAVLLDGPHDPHNGAAVIRSCDAFGVQKLHVLARREPFLVARSVARGSQKWIDVVEHKQVESAVAALAASGHELVATAADGELEPADLASLPRFALVVGNEREGIIPELRAACTRSVRVPMRGFADSLNLSVATAVLLAHAVARRPGDLPEAERRRVYARGLFLTSPRAGDTLARR